MVIAFICSLNNKAAIDYLHVNKPGMYTEWCKRKPLWQDGEVSKTTIEILKGMVGSTILNQAKGYQWFCLMQWMILSIFTRIVVMELLQFSTNYKAMWTNSFWTWKLGQGNWICNKSGTVIIENMQRSSRKSKDILVSCYVSKL